MANKTKSSADEQSGQDEFCSSVGADSAGQASAYGLFRHLKDEKAGFGGTMAAAAGARKIPIIDDEPTIADTLAVIFASSGYDSRAVYSAEQALEMDLAGTNHRDPVIRRSFALSDTSFSRLLVTGLSGNRRIQICRHAYETRHRDPAGLELPVGNQLG